jgi:ABC-type multidrug transport system ATPase subunit
MSERILRALMQLFAIIAKVEIVPNVNGSAENESNNRIIFGEDSAVVESFLRSELNSSLVKVYLDMFEEFIQVHHNNSSKKDGVKKRTSLNSVKVLRICAQINEELTQKQKVIVLIRLFEFINTKDQVSEQEIIFVSTVAEMFNVSDTEYELLNTFLNAKVDQILDDSNVLYISPIERSMEYSKQSQLEGLENDIRILRIQSINTLFFRYFGIEELNMNGQIIPNKTHLLNQGSSIKTLKSQPLYYSDIISKFLEDHLTEKITFKAQDVEYKFSDKRIGLQKVNFIEESGKLFGVMGGSGTGKSTFLNILNGNYKPSSGSVTINGIDIHKQKELLEGVIGFISQDDLLIEELTVYQNLFFNAKLCFNNLSERQIQKKVLEVLSSLGLSEAKDLIVGNPLEQTISGGQRKRLNIALELIREPSVLFVDEPTSGLSSRDSENIIDLLKELTFKGKLIFVVIHQPSSDIFKMFDRLLILDKGGYSIFDGNPIDAVVYFKTHIHHVNANERECHACGNVNPEQIFNVIEAKVIDEYGNLTSQRKTSPKEWYELFLKNNTKKPIEEQVFNLTSSSKKPSRRVQFSVFFMRDLLSKLANKQYLLINLIEAPLLALILSFFVKFYNTHTLKGYSFFENVNIPQYIFISVIVALFLGLTVAAEEINKDKKILKRETFLNLSRNSYLISKTLILFIISGIQTFSFVFIGNFVLEIQGMWLEYWGVLFTMSCLSNMVGLNISSAFNSAKVIYIIVPLLIIPQLLFSGVIVKFDKLNPVFSQSNEVPWLGNLMAARWAYEALAVVQSTENDYEKKFYTLNQQKSNASWKKDFWLPEISKQISKLSKNNLKTEEFEATRTLLINEISKEENNWSNFKCNSCADELENLKLNSNKTIVIAGINQFLSILKNQYIDIKNKKTTEIEQLINKIGDKKYQYLKNNNQNESLQDVVTNRRELEKIVNADNEFTQKDNPIYNKPKGKRFLDSHFYAPEKYIFGQKVSTFWSNIAVMWLMTVFFAISLYYEWLKILLRSFEFYVQKIVKKNVK